MRGQDKKLYRMRIMLDGILDGVNKKMGKRYE